MLLRSEKRAIVSSFVPDEWVFGGVDESQN